MNFRDDTAIGDTAAVTHGQTRRLSQTTRNTLALLLITQLILAGCKGDGEGSERLVSTGTGDATAPSDATPKAPADAPPTTPAAGGVLTSFFVKSFDAYEEAAAALRKFDPRYTVQNNSWRIGTGGTTYHSYPLASARVEYAHAAGLTGAGQLVSVVDSGFLPGHEVFAGKTIVLPEGSLAVADHGTGVASVVAGNGASMIGVAPEAALAFGEYTDAGRTAATVAALQLGAVAQNNSWGFPTLAVSRKSFDAVFSGTGASYLSALDAYAAEGVVVFAASNEDSRTTATLMEALPSLRPGLEAGWLAVVNAVPTFDSERILSAQRISAPCLEAARWCLVADGTWVMASATAPDAYDFATGTSFAAPQVSGALALLAEAFPDLGPHDLRIRLLASADNSFFSHTASQELVAGFWHGYSTEFGHGFLDLRAALLPIGGTEMELASGMTVSSDAPLIVSGSASGDAVVAALSARRVLVADALGGDFLLPGDALVAQAAAPALFDGRLARRLDEDLTRSRLSDAGGSGLFDGYAGTLLGFDGASAGMSYALALPSEDGGGALGATVSRSLHTDAARFDIGFSVLQEEGEVIGLTASGSGKATAAVALELAATTRLANDLTLKAEGTFGQASVGGSEVFDEVSALGFNNFAVDLGRRNAFLAGDRLTLRAEMPTAIVRGSAAASLPVARTASGTVFDDVTFGLSPAERQIDIGIGYQMRLGNGWEAVVEGVHAINHGHVGGERASAMLIGVKRDF